MSYAIALPQTGIGGWRLLARTASVHQAIIAKEAGVTKTHDHLRSALPKMTSGEAFVRDYPTLRATLEAFGLEGDIRNKAFIRKVVESDLADPKSLANRLSDKRYLAMAKALNLAAQTTSAPPGKPPKTGDAVEAIIERHVSAVFETRVGERDGNLRLALYARRELAVLAQSGATDATKWYTVIGSKQLRTVVATAFGFPKGFEKLPVDRQLTEFRAAASKMFGTTAFSALSNDGNREKLIEHFLVRAQASATATSSINSALILLSGR